MEGNSEVLVADRLDVNFEEQSEILYDDAENIGQAVGPIAVEYAHADIADEFKQSDSIRKKLDVEEKKKNMNFYYSIDGQPKHKHYKVKDFMELDASRKALLAVGSYIDERTNGKTQMEYIDQLVNKGMVNGSRLGKKQLKELLKASEQNHLISFDDNGYRLLPAAKGFIDSGKIEVKTESPESSVDAISGTDDTPLQAIAPSTETVSEEKKHKLTKIPYREVQVLAELEEANGHLGSKMLGKEIVSRTGENIAEQNFNRAIGQLIRKGWVSQVSEKGFKIIELETDGKDIIANFKRDYFDNDAWLDINNSAPEIPAIAKFFDKGGRQEYNKPPEISTGYYIMEVIADMVCEQKDKWPYPVSNEDPISRNIAERVKVTFQVENIEPSIVNRQIYRLKHEKGFVELLNKNAGGNNRDAITNIQINEKGWAYLEKLRNYIREQDGMLPDNEVWDLRCATDECIAIAKASGYSEVVEELQNAINEKDPAELSAEEFVERSEVVAAYLSQMAYPAQKL